MYTASQIAHAIADPSVQLPAMMGPASSRAFQVSMCGGPDCPAFSTLMTDATAVYNDARTFGAISLAQAQGGELPPVMIHGKPTFVNPSHAQGVLASLGKPCMYPDQWLGEGESGLVPLKALGGSAALPRPEFLIAQVQENKAYCDDLIDGGRAFFPTDFRDNFSLAPVDEYQVQYRENAKRLSEINQRRVALNFAAYGI